jgi:hypothetical protein
MNYNNINNNGFNVRLNSVSDINTTYNWWGTTNETTISESIYDFYDDFNLGTVTFIPFLTEPNPEAPTIPTFTISASAGAGGSISPSGTVSVNYGSNQSFTVTPNTGYQIVSVLMDGVPATAPYTFFNVVSNGHTISATFGPTPTPSPSPSPTPSPTPGPTTSPTPTPTPTPTATPAPASTPTPSQEPTSTPKPQQPEPFPTTLVITSVITVAVVGIGLLVYFKKRSHAGIKKHSEIDQPST